MKAIIVDDEAKARMLLAAILQEYCPAVKVIAQVGDVPEAVLAINKHQPDVVFLDVDMPVYNGFQLFNFFEEVKFKTIFTTAHSDYAIKAFRFAAVDYLLKPLHVDDVVESVARVAAMQTVMPKSGYTQLTNNLTAQTLSTITLSTNKGLSFLPVKDILYLEADGRYTIFHLEIGETKMVAKTLKEYETILSQHNFLRIHRSYLVKKDAIKELIKTDGGSVILSNKKELPITKEAQEWLLKLM